MSIYKGQTLGTSKGQPLDERLFLSANVQDAEINTFNPSIYSVPSPFQGTETRLYPSILTTDYQGIVSESVNSPFYQGVYFQQSAVIVNQTGFQLGLVTEAQTVPCEVFATFSYKTTVASVGVLDPAAGISVSGLSVADTFYPYEEKSIDLIIAKVGSPSIDTYLYLTFDGDPITYLMPLKGLRVEQMYMSNGPNWAEGVSVSRRFLTSVFSSYNGAETRKILRNRPVRSLEVTIPYFTKYEAGKAWASLRKYTSSLTAHPWYPDQSNMTQAPDAFRVYCDVDYRRFQEGAYAFLVKDNSNVDNPSFELVKIDTLLSDGFSTDDEVTGSYVAGDRVYPALICLAASGGIEQSMMTDFKAEVSLLLEEVYQTETLAVENETFSPTIKNSLPVLELPTTFTEQPTVDIDHLGDDEDSGRGFIQHRYGVPFVRQSATAINTTREECWECMGFFNYLRGRGKSFWMRSTLDTLIVAGYSGNTIFDLDTTNDLADFEYLKYVWVQDSAGAYDILEVLGYATVGDYVRVTIDTNSLADISRVWQAHAVRLDSDEITEDYLTDAKMLCSFSVMELQGI